MAANSETVYIKADRNVEVTKAEVTLGDVVTMECANPSVVPKLNTIKLLKFHHTDKKHQNRTTVSILRVIECIHEQFPNMDVQSMGEADFIVTYEEQQTAGGAVHLMKVVGVVIISFIGAAFSIMAFNNDVGTTKMFSQIYELVTGKTNSGFTILELTYWIGRFSGLQNDMKYASNERILLEVEILRLCSTWADTDLTALAARLAGLERKVAEGVTVTVTEQVSDGAVKKEKPKAKRKPPALPEDKENLQKEWPLLRNEIGDPILKSKLSRVEIGFKEDDNVYLVCEYGALADMVQKYLPQITEKLEKATGKTFQLQTLEKAAYDQWREANYGAEEEAASDENDPEWASIMSGYFPEADMEP